jgi:hypothetical protein
MKQLWQVEKLGLTAPGLVKVTAFSACKSTLNSAKTLHFSAQSFTFLESAPKASLREKSEDRKTERILNGFGPSFGLF